MIFGSFARKLLAVSVGALALACNSDKSTCGDDEDCPELEADALAADAVFTWDTANTFDARLGGETTTARVKGGGAVFTPLDPHCSDGCEYTLKSLYFELERLSFVTDGSISVDDLRLGIDPESPASLPDSSGGHVIPAGTETLGCATVNGDPLSTQSVFEKAATLVIEPATETFRFAGELRFEFGAMPNRECTDYELTLTGTAVAAVPWAQNPGQGGAGGEPGAD